MSVFDIVGNILGLKSKSPDYTAAANAQGAANLDTALKTSLLNNPDMVTPFGSSTYSGPTDGSGRQTLTQTLSPAEQLKLDKANSIQSQGLDILNGNMGNVSKALTGDFTLPGAALTDYDPRYAPTERTQTNLSFAGAPGMPHADANVLQQVEDAMYGQGAQYLDPQYKQMQDQMESKLANQGIVPGTQAYNDAVSNFGLQKQKAYGDLTQSSVLSGQTAMQNLYDMALKGRQQGVSEATTQGQFQQAGVGQQAQIASNQAGVANSGRAQNLNELVQSKTMPLNQINALLEGGQINNPQFQPTAPTQIQPAPIMQGTIAQGQQDAANQSAKAGFWGQVIGAGAKLSDRRLKSNIQRIGERFGLPWYSFDILGDHREGVMADEAPAHALVSGPLGFKMVNYAALGA